MEPRNNRQNAKLHRLIGRLGIDIETKAELVESFTDHRTNSSKSMYWDECEELLSHLRAIAYDTQKSSAQKMRRKIFWYFRKSDYLLPNGKVDQQAVYAWVMERGYLKKSLMDYTQKELPKLVYQAEQVYHDYLNTI